MLNIKAAGIRRPAGIVVFPVLLLLVASLSARFGGFWLNRIFHSQRTFVYDRNPPEIAVNQETINRLKQQMLAADDPRWMILYCQAGVFAVRSAPECDFSLTAEEKQRIARWLDDPDSTVSRAAHLLTDGSIFVRGAVMPADSPGDATPAAIAEIRISELEDEGRRQAQEYLQARAGNLSWRDFLEDSIDFRPHRIFGAWAAGGAVRAGDMDNSSDPLLRFINYCEMRARPEWSLTSAEPGGVQDSPRVRWEQSLQERPCLILELLAALSEGQLGVVQEKIRSGLGPQARQYPELIPATPPGIEEEISQAMAGLHLDERTADFAVPAAAEMEAVRERCRAAAFANPGRFELVWAAVKLELLTRQDYDSVKLLYLMEKNPANLARIVGFACKIPATPGSIEMIRCLMLSSGEPGLESLSPVLLAAWYNQPSYDWLKGIFTAAAGNQKFAGDEATGFLVRWLDKARVTPAQKLQLLLLLSRDLFGGQVDQLDDWLPRSPAEEQLPLLHDYYEKCPRDLYRLWAGYQLSRRGEVTGLELAANNTAAATGAPHAWGILYYGQPREQFQFAAFRRACYANPVTVTRLIEEGLFSSAAMDAGTHDLLESMAVDLVPYNFGVFKKMRVAIVREMERLGVDNSDYWGLPRSASSTTAVRVFGGQNPAGVASNRSDFKLIAAADDAAAFWALYGQAPESLWRIRAKGLGARYFLGFLNDPNSMVDREKMLDELLDNCEGEAWTKTVAAEKIIGTGTIDGLAGFPIARVPQLTTDPQVDGQISAAERAVALRLAPGHQEVAGEPLATEVFLAYNSEGLYLAWSAADRKERIEGQAYDHNGAVFKRESFAFFIDVMRLARKLASFSVDYWGKGSLETWETTTIGGGLKRQVPINWEGERWAGEAFLTWTELLASPPLPGTVWRMNFRRNQIEGTQANSYQWVEMPKNPYQPEYYGFIVFE